MTKYNVQDQSNMQMDSTLKSLYIASLQNQYEVYPVATIRASMRILLYDKGFAMP